MKKIFSGIYGSGCFEKDIKTDKPLEPYTFTYNTDDLFALIEDFGLDQVILDAQSSVEEGIKTMWKEYNS